MYVNTMGEAIYIKTLQNVTIQRLKTACHPERSEGSL